MSEPQPPAGRSARRHSTQGPDDALAALARAAASGLPDGGGQQAIRAAGVPLVAAALVAGATGTASAQTLSPEQVGSHSATASTPGSRASTTQYGAGAARAASPKAARPAMTGSGQGTPEVTYTVKSGDTIVMIAARTKLSVQSIISANHLPPSGLIYPGQVLILPGLTPAQTKPSVTPKTAVVAYTVKAGDTVSDLAKRYKISTASIITANRLTPEGLIRPGQRLVLPGVAAKPVAVAEVPPTHGYEVKAGDSLIGISRAQKVDLADVLRLNHLTEQAVIHPGQRLLLPGPDPNAVPNTFLGRTYPDAVAQAAAANRATLATRQVPTRDQMQAIVIEAARSMGVDPALAQAIAYQESGFNQRVVSPANAIGCMQVIPRTGVWASDLVGRPLDLLDGKDNATAGVAVLAALLAQAPERDAIAGYYQGLASVRAHGMYDDTRRYVASVLTLKARFAAATDPGPAAAPSPQPDPQPAPPTKVKSSTSSTSSTSTKAPGKTSRTTPAKSPTNTAARKTPAKTPVKASPKASAKSRSHR